MKLVALSMLLAPLFRRHERIKHEREGMAFWLASSWLASMYARYGTDEQLDDLYSIMHGMEIQR